MPANTTPIYTNVARADIGQLSIANTNRDGTGTVVTVATAGANGTRIDLIRICATVTTTAGVVRLFIYDGTNYRLYREILVTAITPSTTVEVYSFSFRPDEPLILPSGYSLRASTHNGETFNVHIHGGDY